MNVGLSHDLAQSLGNPEEYRTWLIYALELLDFKSRDQGELVNPDFDLMLADLRGDIQQRLNKGIW